MMEMLFRKQLDKCKELELVLSLYDLDVTHRGVPKSYEALLNLVRIHLHKKRRDDNKDQMTNSMRHDRGGAHGPGPQTPQT